MVRRTFQDTTVLYVEPNQEINESVSKFLTTFFKKVYIAKNGKEGCEIFVKDFQSTKSIDLIISEIDMPIKNGLDMIRDIHLINHTIPFVLLTNKSDSQYMLEAIKLGVSHYVMKPVVLDDLLEQLEDICSHKFQLQRFINKEKELQEYINIINNVAIVSTTDTRGIITYVNDIFCKTSGYTKDELIGKPHNIIRHPEMSKDIFENLWSLIKRGLTWNGKIKNMAKDGNTYYVDANIFPLFYDDNQTIKGYMGVRFLTTDLEIEKRQFKQKVVQNLIKQKSIICAYESTISNLNEENKLLNSKVLQFENMDLFFDKLTKEKQKNLRLLSQLDAYEKQFEGIITKNQEIALKAKQSEQKSLDELKSIKVKYESSKFTMANQAQEIEKKEKVIYTLQERIDEYLKTIENLQDVIKFKEKEQRDQIHKEASTQNQEVTNL